MAESTLSYGYPELQREVGWLLRYGRDPAAFSANQLSEIDFIIQSGYRQFLFPPPLSGEPFAHVWSFLSPVGSLATDVVNEDYDLADNFGGIIGELTFSDTTCYPPIPLIGDGQIRLLRMQSSQTGRPRKAAVAPKLPSGTTGQRFILMLWPKPGAIYTLNFRFNLLVDSLTTAKPYPIGGMAHAETILESCLAVAERRMEEKQDVHWKTFYEERLPASVAFDRRMITPHSLGYDADHSDYPDLSLTRGGYSTYNGVLP